MDNYKVSQIRANTVFTADVYLDPQFLITPSGCPLTLGVINALKQWNFENLSSEGKESKVDTAKEQGEKTEKPDLNNEKAKAILSKTEEVNNIVEEVEEVKEEKEANPEIHKALEEAKNETKSDKSRMEIVQEIYDKYLKYIESIFTTYVTQKKINADELNETIKELCSFITDNRRYVLRIIPSLQLRNKNFLVSHSMRSTVLAITIGLQLRMPQPKLIELGVASVLHEIGMLRLSPNLYMKDTALTPAERNQILTHPIISYNILKDMNFPLNILLGILDHHEREDGSGYPRRIRGNNISLYAKIIAVACSFEAITAPRHFKEARTTYDAMIEMLKNPHHQYDDTVLKALLYSLSIYPIGAFVYLSNGKLAQVVDVAPDNPKNPIVQILGKKDANGNPITAQTNDTDIKIVRVMNKKEAEDVVAALQKLAAKQ
ncbi:MAG: HD-GYP domain-containing protein [Treponema sp.]|nr:HD-GYP domain-containing protein [Treponema sp.]